MQVYNFMFLETKPITISAPIDTKPKSPSLIFSTNFTEIKTPSSIAILTGSDQPISLNPIEIFTKSFEAQNQELEQKTDAKELQKCVQYIQLLKRMIVDARKKFVEKQKEIDDLEREIKILRNKVYNA